MQLNVNTDMIIKYVKPAELITKIMSAFLNTQTFKDNLKICKCLSCNKNYQKDLIKLKEAIF